MVKGFAGIYIMVSLLILGAIAGVYYLGKNSSKPASKPTPVVTSQTPQVSISPTSQTADEATNPDLIGANWKTYTNTKYNYSLKYPPTFKFQESSWGSVDFYAIIEDKLPKRIELPNYYGRHLATDYYGDDITKEAQKYSGRPLKEVNFEEVTGFQITDDVFLYYLTSTDKKSPVLRFMYLPKGDTMNPETEEEIQEKVRIYTKMIKTIKFN